MYFNIQKASLIGLVGLSAVAMAAPAPQVDVNGDGKIDKILFEVTSTAEATSTVEVPLGGNVVLEEKVTAIAAASVIVADIGRAICTISTASSEADVTDTIRVGWKKVFTQTEKSFSEVKSISCDYCDEDKEKYGKHRNYSKGYGHGGSKKHNNDDDDDDHKGGWGKNWGSRKGRHGGWNGWN
jgi:hypothetical protein